MMAALEGFLLLSGEGSFGTQWNLMFGLLTLLLLHFAQRILTRLFFSFLCVMGSFWFGLRSIPRVGGCIPGICIARVTLGHFFFGRLVLLVAISRIERFFAKLLSSFQSFTIFVANAVRSLRFILVACSLLLVSSNLNPTKFISSTLSHPAASISKVTRW